MESYLMDELCEAMEKLTLSESQPKSPKKKRSPIRCWKCSELGHMKRFCTKSKSTQWLNRKRKRNNFQSSYKESNKIRTMSHKSGRFKLKPSILDTKPFIGHESDEKRPLKSINQEQINYKEEELKENYWENMIASRWRTFLTLTKWENWTISYI